jgi:hypothetical protein
LAGRAPNDAPAGVPYPEIHTALLVLACSILFWRRLKSL